MCAGPSYVQPQTYVLFNIQQLTSLDTLVLADETKQLAEATYMKKKMYYNMRIKTLRRNTTNALRRAQEGSALKIDRANQILNTLTRSCKGVEREIEEAEFYGGEQSAVRQKDLFFINIVRQT
jgi:hypothetical protein